MPFENDSNRKRVAKAIEAIDLIEKSARANRTPPGDVAAMLAPLAARLTAAGALPGTGGQLDPAPAPVPRPSAPQPPLWATIRDMAEKAPLRDLTVALAVFLNRVEEELPK